MREIRLYGSEGGGTQANGSSLPLCASASVFGPRGGSPLQARTLRPVTERNCVAARRGGEQREVNDQSATQVNSIRPCRAVSLLGLGETRTGVIRKSVTLRGSVSTRSGCPPGGWSRNDRKVRHKPQRDRSGTRGPRVSRSGATWHGSSASRALHVSARVPEQWRRQAATSRRPTRCSTP